MAQRTKANLKSTINTQFPTNGTGQIAASRVRTYIGEDIADSALFIEDNFIDEDSFASDDATKVPSQQSVKAYVDSYVHDSDKKYFEQCECLSLTDINGFSTLSSGAGAAASLSNTGTNSTENTLGVIGLATGTTTTGRTSFSKASDLVLFGINFEITFGFRAALSALSDGTDTYTAYLGFFDNTTSGDCTDGAYFRYTHGTNSGKWQAVTRAASAETAEDTTIAADTVFNVFKIVANAAGTQIDFYINGTKYNDITTNIPTSTNYTTFCFKIEKSAGTTSRILYLDWFDIKFSRTSAR